MHTFDDTPFRELVSIGGNLNKDTIGDSMMRAIALRSIILDPFLRAKADEILDRIRAFTRDADLGWRIFETPMTADEKLTEIQVWQLIAIIGTLQEFNYLSERVEEASLFTFENSAPVRFYVNGVFHYLTALFLLDFKDNKKKGFVRPGTLIKALAPMGLERLLEPIYEIFDRPFGEEMTYGQTVLSVRNKGFVHGSFSPENIERLVKDSHIFSEVQKMRFVQNHWDLFDRIIILRLQLISILTFEEVNFADFSPAKIYHL